MELPKHDSLKVQGVQVAVIATYIDSSMAYCRGSGNCSTCLELPFEYGNSGTGEWRQACVLSVLVKHRP